MADSRHFNGYKKEKHMNRKQILAVGGAVAFATTAFADARSLVVGEPDGSGNVAITIGGVGSVNQTLIAAWANGDRGANPLEWTEYADAGTVAPGDTALNFTIPAAWRAKSGVVRFFLMSGEKPYGVRYDYITRPECTGNSHQFYIDTGIKPDASLDITVKLKSDFLESHSISPFGAAGSVYILSLGDNQTNQYFFDFMGANRTVSEEAAQMKIKSNHKNVFGEPPPTDANPHTFRMNREGIFIDGYCHLAFNQSVITNAQPAYADNTIYLFDRSGSSRTQSGTTCSIFCATIVTNGIVACDFVPAFDSTTRKVGMWNRVTGEWKFALGGYSATKSFGTGGDIGPYPPDCGSVEAMSSIVSLGPVITVSNLNPTEMTVDVSLSSGHDTGLLFAFAANVDAGSDFASWPTNTFVQRVAADVDALTVTLPREFSRFKHIRLAWKSLSGKPYDYDVSCLHSDATLKAHVDTGWCPTTNTSVSVTARTDSNVCPFGISPHFQIFLNGTTDSYRRFFAGFFGATEARGLTLEQTGLTGYDNYSEFIAVPHDWEVGIGGGKIDGQKIWDFAGDPNYNAAIQSSVLANIVIPFRVPYDSASTSLSSDNNTSKVGNVDVYGAKIWDGGVLVRDFVPCVTNGVPVFYDRVNGKFLGSIKRGAASGSPFRAGAIVTTAADAISWSGDFSLRRGFVLSFR